MPFELVASGAAGLLGNLISSAIAQAKIVDPNAPLEELKLEAERQEFGARIAQSQARVAQELAIAHRIENAAEVIMEEFYDYQLEGKAGVQTDSGKVSASIGASNKRVSKRVYRFKGQLQKAPQSAA
jgi:hypothetical protein